MKKRRNLTLYLFRHPVHGEATANGSNKLEAVKIVARSWGRRWTKIAKESEIIPLISERDLGKIGRGKENE